MCHVHLFLQSFTKISCFSHHSLRGEVKVAVISRKDGHTMDREDAPLFLLFSSIPNHMARGERSWKQRISLPEQSRLSFEWDARRCAGSVRKRALVVNIFPLVPKRVEGCWRRFLYHSVSDRSRKDQRPSGIMKTRTRWEVKWVDWSLPGREVRGSGEITLRFKAFDPLA